MYYTLGGIHMNRTKLWNKDFMLLIQGTLFSTFGAVLYSAAIAYWVYEKTASTTLMGILSGISFFIRTIAGPISGTLTDHLRRRNILVYTDLVRGVVFTVLGLLAFRDKMSVPMVVIVALISGICSSLFDPASSSLAPDMLNESILIKGQSLLNGSMTIINLIGTALSGILIVRCGVPMLIIVNGICYIISAISERFIHDYPSHKSEKVSDMKTIVSDIKEGITYFRNDKGLLKFALCCILGNFFVSGFFNLLLPYCLQNNMSTEQYGYLGAFISAGSLIGTLLPAMTDIYQKRPMRYVVMGLIIFTVAGTAAVYTASYLPTAVLFFICFIANGFSNGILNGLLIMMMPEDKRGMMMGMFMTAVMIGNALSSLVYGVLGDLIPLKVLGTLAFMLVLIPITLAFSEDVQELKIRNNKKQAVI